MSVFSPIKSNMTRLGNVANLTSWFYLAAVHEQQ